MFTEPDDRWLKKVAHIVAGITGEDCSPRTAPYFTDASVLAPYSGSPPVVILGPGDLAQAHRVNETCDVARIEQASEMFLALMLDASQERAVAR